jgi:glycosyltransferase involved in cell wall biosynthesis
VRALRVLFVEPFYGGSHRAFRDGLAAHSRHEIVPLTLQEGEWRRRMRRGAQELSDAAAGVAGEFDLLIVTDMLDLPAFLALTRRRFAATPVLLYMHENQLTYPRLRGTKLNSWFGQINYLSAVAADAVAFNSEFHRRDFLDALRALARQPNNWLIPEAIATIEAKSRVLPIGLELAALDAVRPNPKSKIANLESPLVLWNHRWEFDKAPRPSPGHPDLAEQGVPFRLAIAGEPGDNPSPALYGLRDDLGERVIHFGHLPGDRYARLLWESDVVVSTARHDFFGVATVEALYCRCLPVVPANYNYPNLIPEGLGGRCLWESEAACVDLLERAITDPASTADLDALRLSASRFAWEIVAAQWDDALATSYDAPLLLIRIEACTKRNVS